MIRIYGTKQCKYCASFLEDLDAAGIPYEYKDILGSLADLKEFMKLRDTEPAFATVKGKGVGIPCIVREDGSASLDWREFL